VGLGGKSWTKLEGEAEKEARTGYTRRKGWHALRGRGEGIGMKGGKWGRKRGSDLERRGKFGGDAP